MLAGSQPIPTIIVDQREQIRLEVQKFHFGQQFIQLSNDTSMKPDLFHLLSLLKIETSISDVEENYSTAIATATGVS
jgi:hypothetical protein